MVIEEFTVTKALLEAHNLIHQTKCMVSLVKSITHIKGRPYIGSIVVK